ncbi:MAG TPA: tRNA(Ile)(2)-agmatinylcytidine synthase [Candidatus Bathyarchaeia archaeon]|nr:tRNA(Ile)(2)-agmatinylcytidine synthase [Candidatus Bathyarchaeia archaeon]
MIIGIDDTDSKNGMCTTYLCAVLVDELRKYGEVSTPRLVRLNPCIPFKTRGNGAVSFEITVTTAKEETVKGVVKSGVSEFSELQEEETNPGVVFIGDTALRAMSRGGSDEKIERMLKLKNFYETAVRDVLKIEHAYTLLSDLHFDYFGLKKKRGLIGALAAASFLMLQKRDPNYYDFTYELIAYRRKERWGTSRFIEEASVRDADEATYPLTWDTVDLVNKKLVLAPHSPCPVLFGIRGDSVAAIHKAYTLIDAEPAEREMLFVTNQGTDSHLVTYEEAKGTLHDHHSYILDGAVESNPRTIEGGHVLFALALTENTGDRIECMAYEPTKGFRDIIRQLRIGDEVTVYGSFKNRTINLEKIKLRKLNVEVKSNPKCAKCGKRMESAGRSQGYRCKRCKTYSSEKEVQIVDREIDEGLYEVPPVARRHISKPLIRTYAEGRINTTHPSR